MKYNDDKYLNKIIKKLNKIAKAQTKEYRKNIGFDSSSHLIFLKKVADLKSWQKNYDELITRTEHIAELVENTKKEYATLTDKNSKIIKKRDFQVQLYIKQMLGDLVYKYETLRTIKDDADKYDCIAIIEDIDVKDAALLTQAIKIAKKSVDSPLLLDCLCRKYIYLPTVPNGFESVVDDLLKFQDMLDKAEIADKVFEEKLENLYKEREEIRKEFDTPDQDIENIIKEFDVTSSETTKSRLEPKTNQESTKKASNKKPSSNLVSKTANHPKKNTNKTNLL